jgi:hypothetical protein
MSERDSKESFINTAPLDFNHWSNLSRVHMLSKYTYDLNRSGLSAIVAERERDGKPFEAIYNLLF